MRRCPWHTGEILKAYRPVECAATETQEDANSHSGVKLGGTKNQTKVGAADFQTVSFTGLNWCTEHDSCEVSLVCFYHKATTLRVLNVTAHTHTWSVLQTHTQAWLIGACTVITAEAIRLVPAPWATQQGVARQRGLV